MSIKFLLYILMKKKEKQPIDSEMQALLDENNYTPLEEWKANGAIPNTDNGNQNGVQRDCQEAT